MHGHFPNLDETKHKTLTPFAFYNFIKLLSSFINMQVRLSKACPHDFSNSTLPKILSFQMSEKNHNSRTFTTPKGSSLATFKVSMFLIKGVL